MVRDYGTHYISSTDAGAVFAQVDFIRSSQVEDKSRYESQVTASASANFFNKVSLSSTFKHSTSDYSDDYFIGNRTYSKVITIGGPPFTPNLTLAEWEQGVADNLVSIDRSGDPLHFVINPTTLPTLPETTVRTVAKLLKSAINRYYKANTRPGCTDPGAENFNFQANLNDKTCKPPTTNFTFGGIYQTCTVDPNNLAENLCTDGPQPALQKNLLTGDLSCPPQYTPILLHSGIVTHVIHKPKCNNVCHHCGWWSRCCHCESVMASFLSRAYYSTYWCAALNGVQVNQNEGYLFGGYYTSKISNPITGAMSCPQFYTAVHMFEDTTLCVSSDYERASAYSVDFAGFESCSIGNPLASPSSNINNTEKWPRSCPHGYAQHLVTVEDGCEINVCVRAGALNSKSLAAIKLPPFRKHPKYKANVTDTLAVFGLYGRLWVKNDEGGWNEIDPGSENGQALISQLSQPEQASTIVEHKSPPSSGVVAVISVISTVVLGVVIVAIVFIGQHVYKKRKKGRRNGCENYVTINDSDDGGREPHAMQNAATADPI